MAKIEDPIEFELFKNAIFAIADEMAVTICRTTYSGVLRDNMDFSTALADANGKMVAQGLTLPGHLGSIPAALAVVVERFAGDIHPGDMFILNDPFDGGMHLPDIFIFQPLYHEGKRVAFAATISHHSDVGGRVPGSNASDSTEIYQEGLRIPPLKLFDQGKRNETMWSLIEKNVRIPIQVLGDLRAQLAACHIAETQFAELLERYGLEKVALYMEEVIDYAERLTRAAIAELPDGQVFHDKEGNARHFTRVRWWPVEGKRWQDISIGMPSNHVLNNQPFTGSLPGPVYSPQEKPVFFGHYWLKGTPHLLADNICCLDYSVAKGGDLVAYRWSESKS